jgi:hypothetical protein
MIKRSVSTLAISVFRVSALSMPAQDKTTSDACSGAAIGTGGSVGGKTIQFDFRNALYTTDEEVQSFAQLVKDKGTDALRRTLDKEDKGRINVVGSTGSQIAVARKRQYGPDSIVTIAPARTMSFLELHRSGRSTDYPFGYLQVKLEAAGQGTGQLMAAAKIRFDKKKGTYEIESYGNQQIKATRVHPGTNRLLSYSPALTGHRWPPTALGTTNRKVCREVAHI